MEGLLQAGSSYFYYNVTDTSSGWKSSEILSHYQAIDLYQRIQTF
ncbi:hypothetical protein E1A91_D12G063700v1 [Gossypium mustelinum]|uniref:Uncharacterized protein n=1 Tax=Gossypium mustelinum TaxID=34275 RepID=A0A5D2SBE3_GOSMU|nr:hypothetical protein E1A91_D12G063700v1 [Gossypium mustelinum]